MKNQVCLWFVSFGLSLVFAPRVGAEDAIRVGWIGSMTGPISKYGAYQAAQLALEDINASGGIGGKPLEVIFEDGKGNGKAAVDAANKLIQIDRVRYILGGHCTPESLPIAPIAERNHVLMLAALTSNPYLTNAGDYVFRVSPVSTKAADVLVPYMLRKLEQKKLGVLYEETDYARPTAERVAELFEKGGGKVVRKESYLPGETDFRSLLGRFRLAGVDSIFIGTQAPETAAQILTQVHDLHLDVALFGNESTGNVHSSVPVSADVIEGLTFSEPSFDEQSEKTKKFIERYKARYHVDGLPFGLWTAEVYDAMRLLAESIEKCGDDVEKVKACLYAVREYEGVSGKITIDANGDGVRVYSLKTTHAGVTQPVVE